MVKMVQLSPMKCPDVELLTDALCMLDESHDKRLSHQAPWLMSLGWALGTMGAGAGITRLPLSR